MSTQTGRGPATCTEDPLMTTTQVAEYLSIPLQSLYMLRHRRLGPPAIRISAGTIRFRKSAVDRWLGEHAEEVA